MSIGTTLGRTTRLVTTVWLIYEVWKHAHWSVALVLTFMTIGTEIDHVVLRALWRRR